MAVAGKVAITLSTENGGAWSADVTYDRLVAVKHNNNLYISRKTVANVEPPNDEFWFLALEGFGGEDVETLIDRMNELSDLIQAILDGTTQVGNAKTLDGHGAEYFSKKTDVESILNGTSTVELSKNSTKSLNSSNAEKLNGYGYEHFATNEKVFGLEGELIVERARIDNLSANSGEQTEGNLELLDMRVGAFGYVYDSAGSALRSQISDAENNLYEVKSNVMTENMFNKDTCVLGKMLSANDVEKSDSRFFYSDYIKVKPNREYTISAHVPALYNYYNYNKEYVGTKSISATGYDYTFTTESDAYYIRFNGIMASYSSVTITPSEYMFVEGNALPELYVPYGANNNVLYNKIERVVSFGDSITWQDEKPYKESHSEYGKTAVGYQTYLRQILGVETDNQGYIGHTMPQILSYVKEYDYSTVDCVTLTAGANDFRYSSVGLGEVKPIGSEFDESTYIGAFQAAIEHILGANPRCRIVVITPIKGYSKNTGVLRVMPKEYPDALKEIANLYSLPLCDWYYHSGINELTLSVYNGDSEDLSYKLHPTNAGYERMGMMLVNTIKNI